jgi:hypothetical protein
MNHARYHNELVLAIAPTSRGFGYVVTDGPLGLIDWGVKEVRGDKNRKSLERVKQLMGWFHPELVILEDCAAKGSRRAPRIRRLVQQIARLAGRRGLRTVRYSRAELRALFEPIGAVTKQEIAMAVVGQLPELEPWLPPRRRIWMSEDPRQSIFDAVALTFVYFYRDKHDPGASRCEGGDTS